MAPKAPTTEDVRSWPVTVDVRMAGSAWSLGRDQAYRLAREGDAGQDRVVMLGERTLTGLKEWQAEQDAERDEWGPAYHDQGYVFTREDGRPYHPDYLTKVVGRLMRRAGIADARLHSLRQFYAAVSKALGTAR
jgi:integrase